MNENTEGVSQLFIRALRNSCLLSLGALSVGQLAADDGITGYSLHDNVKISWLGHAAFKIETGKGVSIITDPYSEKTGYKMPKVEADIVTVSHQHYDHNNIEAVGGSPKVVKNIGKIVIGSTTLEGIPSFHDEVRGEKRGNNIVFKFYLDGLTLAHMGDFGEPITQNQLDALAGVDVVMIPVGGTFTIDAAQAAEIVNKLTPKVVIPMHYKTADVVIDIAPVGPFLNLVEEVRYKGSSIMLSSKGLPSRMEVWVMDYIQA